MRGTNGQTLLIGAPERDRKTSARQATRARRFGQDLASPGSLETPPLILEDATIQARPEAASLASEVVRAPVPLCALRIEEKNTGRLIAALGPVVRRDVPLFCLDGGNAFNPYRLAVLIRREGGDPQELLDRIYVSRAYTCHQLASSAETLLGALIGARPRPMVAVLGIDRLFHDEDLPMWEREFLYGRLLAHVRALHRRGLPVLVTFSDELKGPWARRLKSIARIVPSPEAVLGRLEAGLFTGRKTEQPQIEHATPLGNARSTTLSSES